MKILYLSTWFPYPPDNGSKLRVYHLLRALAQKHQVTLVSFAFATAQLDASGDLRDWCQQIHTVPVDPFEINRAGALSTFLSLRPMASRPVAAMSQLTTGMMQSGDFEVVIASTEMMMDYALAAQPGTTRILEEHNSMARWAHERYQEASSTMHRLRCWTSWRKAARYTARTYPNFDLVTMVSEADRQATRAAAGADRLRVEVVPNGVDCQLNRPGLARPRPGALVYNGSLTYGANYDAMRWFLAEVYPRLKSQIPGVSLTITGSTRGVDLAGLTLDDTVHLTGFVDDVRLPVAGAELCVVPIRQGGGTRLKILEAMALGTPVVATTKGAEGLDVIDGEHLLLADDAETFAARTLDLLHNPILRQRLATRARQRVETHYDWRSIGACFAGLVEATAAQRGGL